MRQKGESRRQSSSALQRELRKLLLGLLKQSASHCKSNCAPYLHMTLMQGALTDGSVFDSSYSRGDPISFTLGQGQVIKGWDQGISGMWYVSAAWIAVQQPCCRVLPWHCSVGEKRKLRIPPQLGYGDRGSPPKIPGKQQSSYVCQVHCGCVMLI